MIITAHDILKRARGEFLTSPETMCFTAFAEDHSGRAVYSRHPSAARFCSLAAITRALSDISRETEVSQDNRTKAITEAKEALLCELGASESEILASAHDTVRDAESVLSAFDRAIEKTEPH